MQTQQKAQLARYYQFGPFVADASKCVLLRNGQAVPLNLKTFEILMALIRQPGEVVSKDDLMREVWAGIVVEENNLARHISSLRKAMGELPNQHEYILTIPGRGYRFVADIKEIESDVETSNPSLEFSPANAETSVINERTKTVEPPQNLTVRRSRRLRLWLSLVLLSAMAVTGFFWWNRQRAMQTESTEQRKLWQLTFEPGLNSEPSWSPDGNLIAYSSDRSGNFDIWVRPVGEGNPIRVTNAPSHDWQPDWSPVGNRLVFRSERDEGGLFVVPVLGGNERKISSFGYRPRWSPDGTQILFFSSQPQNNTVETPKLYLVGLNGEAPKEVMSDFQAEFLTLRAAWHPDGKQLSVWGNHLKFGWSFWTIPLSGNVPKRSEIPASISQRLSDVHLTDFQWAGTGDTLYFEGTTQSVKNIWKIGVDSRNSNWVNGPERLTTNSGKDSDVAISRDGKKIAFAARSETTRLWSLPFNAATGQVKNTGQPITEVGIAADYPTLSSDGQQFVYRAQRAGKEEVRLKLLKDGTETVLLSDNFTRTRFSFSNDGRQLAYNRYEKPILDGAGGDRAIAYLTIGNSDEHLLTPLSSSNAVAWEWTVDGQNVLGGIRRNNRMLIGLFPLSAAPNADQQLHILTESPDENLWQGRYSPDNRWVSFVGAKANAAGISTIYIVPSGGGERKQITEGKFFDDKPRWSPDGKKIYFISNRTGFLNVWGIGIDAAIGQVVGNPFRVTNLESPAQMILTDVRFMEIALSADRLILPMMEVSGGIWILEN